MSLSPALFRSTRDDWQTPPELFNPLRWEFDLCVDVAASHDNALLPDYFGPGSPLGEDALTANWARFGSLSRCFCNPPYSRGLQAKFLRKAAAERLHGVTTVCLVPARTDTRVWHEVIWDGSTHKPRTGVEVRFLPGRVKFVGAAHGAPFPSAIVIFRGGH